MGRHPGSTTLARILTVVFLLTVLTACLSLGMLKVLNHDEHQFVAPAKLLATKGFLPYSGCPYLHTPNLVLVDALVFAFTDYALLSARLLSVASAFTLLVVLFVVARQCFREQAPVPRFLIAAGVVLLVLTNPLFHHASGRAWNHDLAMLLAVLAVVVHCRAAKREKPARLVFLSGLCLGAAIMTRVAFVPLAVPFLGVLFFFAGPRGKRDRFLSLFVAHGLGLIVAALPGLVVFAMAPARAWYGNVTYHVFSVSWRRSVGVLERLTLFERLMYARSLFSEPGNLLVVVGFLGYAWLPAIIQDPRRFTRRFETTFIWMLVPFLAVVALSPSPTNKQYVYAPIPFLVLGILYGLASVKREQPARTWAMRLFAVLVVACCAYWPPAWRLSSETFETKNWYPLQAHSIGREIRDRIGSGKVLTLSPIFVLEGGLSIYP